MAAHAYHRRVEEPLHSPLHTQTLLPALGRFLFCPSLLMARRVYCRALDPLVDGRTRTLDELHDEPGPIVVSGPILFWKFFGNFLSREKRTVSAIPTLDLGSQL
jgi:hypothetical protein